MERPGGITRFAVTAEELSHHGRGRPLAGLRSRSMRYTILLRFDSAGVCPVLLQEDYEPLGGEEGVRWRLVAQTDECDEAIRIVEDLRRRREAGELL